MTECTAIDQCHDTAHNIQLNTSVPCSEPNCCGKCVPILDCGECIDYITTSNNDTQTSTVDKRRDKDFAKYGIIDGDSVIQVPHMYDSTAAHLSVTISNTDLQYELQPTYLINHINQQSFIYYNAQNPQYYYRPLSGKPILTLWILIKNTQLHKGTYTKRRLYEQCMLQNISCRLLNPNKFDLAVNSNQYGSVNAMLYDGESIELPDIVIPRLGATVDYFGLAVLRQLSSLGVKVMNPVESLEIASDKLFTHQILSTAGIPIPRTVLSRAPLVYEEIEKSLQCDYPIILKMASGSRGEAVWKINSRREFENLVPKLDNSQPLIIQEYLSKYSGRDIRCLVVGGCVVASMMRIAEHGEFKANIHAGATAKPIIAGSGLSELACVTAGLCHLDITGVDILLDSDSYKICEVNSSPGIEGLERATGINCAAAQLDYMCKWLQQQYHSTKSSRVRRFSMSQYVGDVPIQQDLIMQSPSIKFVPPPTNSMDTLNLFTIDDELARLDQDTVNKQLNTPKAT